MKYARNISEEVENFSVYRYSKISCVIFWNRIRLFFSDIILKRCALKLYSPSIRESIFQTMLPLILTRIRKYSRLFWIFSDAFLIFFSHFWISIITLFRFICYIEVSCLKDDFRATKIFFSIDWYTLNCAHFIKKALSSLPGKRAIYFIYYYWQLAVMAPGFKRTTGQNCSYLMNQLFFVSFME